MSLDYLRNISYPSTGLNIYPTDFLDILIISLLIYSLYVFFRKTRTYLVFFGIAITIGLYVLAKTLNLYLTFLTLRYFVGVSLVIFAVIFQHEIRKYFELLGLIGTRQIQVKKMTQTTISKAEIIQACVQMAQSKTGALVVISGKDSLEAFIDGGSDLDGIISEDILSSIFDTHSDGHDGAVIISNNRIFKFGAHLPLSTNFKEIGKHGTRHSAAVGISERTDAFCIIVSEEKGTISISKDGKLKTLSQKTDLEKEMDKFIKDRLTEPTENSFARIFKHNFWAKVASVLSALLLWFVTAYQAEIIEKTYTIPVTLSEIPKSIVVENYNPKEINITVRARGESVFEQVSVTDFEITLDAKSLENGVNKETLEKKDIKIPERTTLVTYTPETVLLTAKKFYAVTVPIVPKTRGQVNRNFEIKNITLTPDSLEILVPQETVAPTEIVTEIIDITGQEESFVLPVKTILPSGIRPSNGDTVVNVAFTVEPK